MPTGGTPPPASLPSSVFSALHAMTYSSTSLCFVDANGNHVYLGIQDDGTGKEQWFYGTNTEIGSNPKALIPSNTALVVCNGSYSNGCIVYQNASYSLRFQRDSQGNHVAVAV